MPIPICPACFSLRTQSPLVYSTYLGLASLPYHSWSPFPVYPPVPFVIDLESSEVPGVWTSEAQVPAIYLQKAINTSETALRRPLLAIYAYLSIQEIETRAVHVCKAWYHVSKDPEHWKSRFISDIRPKETDSYSDYRRKYIFYMRAVCWHCNSTPPCDLVTPRSPLLNRPLCGKCAKKGKCRIETFVRYSRTHFVSLTVLSQLNIPNFDYFGRKSSYILYFRREVAVYASIRRAILLRTIEQEYSGRLDTAVKAAIEAFDLWSYYGQESPSPELPCINALVRFCGKCGRREEENVRIFLRNVEKRG